VLFFNRAADFDFSTQFVLVLFSPARTDYN